MTRVLFVALILALQLRTPETLRPAATPPPEGTGKFQEYAYTFRWDSHSYLIEFTPALPDKRALVLDAMKSACRDLYDLDFTKVPAQPGIGGNDWRFELKDLRVCSGRPPADQGGAGGIRSVRVWMP
jgi:hypothetical protein